MFNDFFPKNGVCFSCRNFNFDHSNLRKISSDAQLNFTKKTAVSDFSLNTFYFENFSKKSFDSNHLLLCLMNKKIINR